MFDIGFAELVLVSVIGLLVLGPERLPGAIRTVSLWFSRLRRSFNSIRAEIEREINADEIKQDIHNEEVMHSLREAEADLKRNLDSTANSIAQPSANPTAQTLEDPPTEKAGQEP